MAAADQAAADAAADAEDAAAAEAAKKLPVPWGTFLRSHAVWAVIVAHFCFNWGYYTLLAWLPSYFDMALGERMVQLDGSVWYSPVWGMFQTTLGCLLYSHC